MRWPACGSARILMLLKRRWRNLPMCLATAWTGRSTSSRVTRGTTACRSSSVAHVRTSVPKRPRPARSWRLASVTVLVSAKSLPHSGVIGLVDEAQIVAVVTDGGGQTRPVRQDDAAVPPEEERSCRSKKSTTKFGS